MAKYVVPSNKKVETPPILLKCYKCKTLYSPERCDSITLYFEDCPICGFRKNTVENEISLWRYNLIKYWRGLFNRDKPDAGGTDD